MSDMLGRYLYLESLLPSVADDDRAERILDEMDRLWWMMSNDEIAVLMRRDTHEG